MSKITSTQPEVTDQRIYGSTKVEPLVAGTPESRQPAVLPHIKVHGAKVVPTIRVTRKGGKSKRVVTINATSYDESLHQRVE